MYFAHLDLLIRNLKAKGYSHKILPLIPPNFEQRGQMCKLLALCSAMQWTYQQTPEQFATPPYPNKRDIRKNHLPQQVSNFKSLREQAKYLNSQVGEVYDVRQLIYLANSNGYDNVYYNHYESLTNYQADLIQAIDQETLINVFYDVDLKEGTPVCNDSRTEHSALVIGYALNDNAPALAIISTHNRYIAIEISALFLSSIQLQSLRSPELFYKDSSKFWRNVPDDFKVEKSDVKVRKGLPPSKEAVSFRGKIVFYKRSLKPQNTETILNENLTPFSELNVNNLSLEMFNVNSVEKEGNARYIPLEVLVHFLETSHVLKLNKQVDVFERYAREFDFGDDIARICLVENQTQISGALMDDIFKQNPETKRSIVEITSNALDSQANKVQVTIVDGEYRVMDDGIGMTGYEIFNNLLLSKISSKNGLVDVIGRFGIGFYTSLSHLKDEDSGVLVKTHSRLDEFGYIIHFRRNNSQMEVNITTNKFLPIGTEVIVKSADIQQSLYETYLNNHFLYTEDERLSINEKQIVFRPSYQFDTNEGGKVLLQSKKTNEKGSLKIVVANVLISEYFYEGKNNDLIVVWKLPNQVTLTESKSAIQIDSQYIVSLIQSLVACVHELPDNLQASYLNTISSGVEDLQHHNAMKGSSYNLMQFLREILAKIVKDKNCIPDEAEYQFLTNSSAVAVSRYILPDNWEDQAGERIEEWRSTHINAYSMEMNGEKHVFYDPYHHSLILSSLFVNHMRSNNLLSKLNDLVEILEVNGNFVSVDKLAELTPYNINTYLNFQANPYQTLFNRHGGLYHVDLKILEQMPEYTQVVLHQTPTLIARYPYRGKCETWDSEYEFDIFDTYSRYTKEIYLNQVYFVKYEDSKSWEIMVYDQHFQELSGERGKFLAAWFRNKHYCVQNEINQELTKLIFKNEDKSCRLVDLNTKETLLNGLPLYSYYLPIPGSEYYCISSIPIDSVGLEGGDSSAQTTIYSNDNKPISHRHGSIRILTINKNYLILNQGYDGFRSSVAISLYSKEFNLLSSITEDYPVYNVEWYQYSHENKQFILLRNNSEQSAIWYDDIGLNLTKLPCKFVGQNKCIIIDNSLYTLNENRTTTLLGRVKQIFSSKNIYGENYYFNVDSRFVIFIDNLGQEKICGSDGKVSSLPKEVDPKQFDSYFYNKEFQSIKLKEGFIFKSAATTNTWSAKHIDLHDSSVDSYAVLDKQIVLNSKDKIIFSQEVVKVASRPDCPYLIIKYQQKENKYERSQYAIIDCDGQEVTNIRISYAEFNKANPFWEICCYGDDSNGVYTKLIINKNGIISKNNEIDQKLFAADCGGYIWYPVTTSTEPKRIAKNAYFLPQKEGDKNKAPASFYKLIDENLLLDLEIAKNLEFLNSKNLRTRDYSNYLRFIDCDSNIFSELHGYFPILEYTPTRQQFRSYYEFYHFIMSNNRDYANVGIRLLDLIYFCAGNYYDMDFGKKIIEICKIYGLGILRDLFDAYAKELFKLYYHIHNNLPLDDIFAPLSKNLREISYFIFSNKVNLLTNNTYQVLFQSSNAQSSSSILDLIATISIRKATVKNAQCVKEVMDTAKRLAEKLDTTLALRNLKHAIYNLSDIGQPIYLREFLQNALDASSDGMSINIEFFSQDGSHVTRFVDSGLGMTLQILFSYLIIPGNSTKRSLSEFIGGRGVGFFSAFNDAKEVNVKTSTGDGTVYYFKFEPHYEKDQKIDDIVITAEERNEFFKGTIIDRISSNEHASLEAARSLSTIRQYGCFIDANRVKIFVNGAQINKELHYLGELQFAKLGKCRIYSNAESSFMAGGLYVKKIDDFYWDSIPYFIMAALKHNGVVIDLPSKIALVRERNNFQNADRFAEHFKPLFFQLCLNAYCVLLKNGKISSAYLPNDLFDYLQPWLANLMDVEAIKDDVESLNQGKLITDYKKYLNHTLCIKLLVHVNFINYGNNQISIASIAQMSQRGQLQFNCLPDFIVSRLKKQEGCIAQYHKHEKRFAKSNNVYEVELMKYKHCSWNLPPTCFEGADNWLLFYELVNSIIASISDEYSLKIDLNFSTLHPTALAYVEPYKYEMVTENNKILKHTIIYINPFCWWDDLKVAFERKNAGDLVMKLVKILSHEIAHIVEGSSCDKDMRGLTHDHFFKNMHAHIFSSMKISLNYNQLVHSCESRIKDVLKEIKSLLIKPLPDAKELMIMQILGKKDYLFYLAENDDESSDKNTFKAARN